MLNMTLSCEVPFSTVTTDRTSTACSKCHRFTFHSVRTDRQSRTAYRPASFFCAADPNKTVPILNVRPSNYGIAKLLMIRWTQVSIGAPQPVLKRY
jgi:hypothetical protein